MKKTILVTVLVLAALGVLTTGVVYAQSIGGGGMMGGYGGGFMHTYIIKAYADALGLTPDALTARLSKGETIYQIALTQGIAADRIPTLLADAHSKALDAAVADGILTADQAAWMKSHNSMMGGYGTGGFGGGMMNGSGAGGFGPGMMGGNGMGGFGPGMMGGGRWQQSNP